jgi:hypothetical protein
MPRAKKTLSGAPASAPTTPVGVPYGEGERRIEAQRRMPVPDFAGGGSAPSAGGTDGGGAAGGGEATDRFAHAIQLMQQMAPPESVLEQPTARPNEPISQGLPTGPTPLSLSPVTNEALYDLRALASHNPEYRGLLRLIALAEEGM